MIRSATWGEHCVADGSARVAPDNAEVAAVRDGGVAGPRCAAGLSAAIVACPAGPPGTAGMAAVAEIRATARPSPRREVLPSRCAARFPAGIFARPPRHGIHDAATSR
jgi:hypothetical protein